MIPDSDWKFVLTDGGSRMSGGDPVSDGYETDYMKWFPHERG